MGLFKPNNHSVSEINYKETDPATRAVLSRVLDMKYGIEEATSIAQGQEAEIHSNNFKIITPKKTYLLRRNDPEHEERLRKTYGVTEHCRTNGAPVPAITPDLTGSLIAKEGKIYTLFPFLEGTHYTGKSLEEVKELARGVAQVHKALSTYEGEVLPAPPDVIRPKPLYSQLGFQHVKEVAELQEDEHQALVLSEIDYLIEKTAEVKAAIGPVEVRTQPIHLDLHPHNTLFKGTKLKTILDFELCCTSELIRDVAYALHRGIRQHVVANNIKEDPSIRTAVTTAKQAFLEAYEEVYPLTDDERRLLPLFIQDEALHRCWLILSNHYYRQDSAWTGDLGKQTLSIKEAEYFKDD